MMFDVTICDSVIDAPLTAQAGADSKTGQRSRKAWSRGRDDEGGE